MRLLANQVEYKGESSFQSLFIANPCINEFDVVDEQLQWQTLSFNDGSKSEHPTELDTSNSVDSRNESGEPSKPINRNMSADHTLFIQTDELMLNDVRN